MNRELIFVLVIAALAIVVFALVRLARKRQLLKPAVLARLKLAAALRQDNDREPESLLLEAGNGFLTAEEKSLVELERLQRLIDDQKQIARDNDVSYHLWGFYENHFRHSGPHASGPDDRDPEWYDIKILQANVKDGFNDFEFELKGKKYKFVDDEERQGWRENIKFFSVFLHDDSDRCLFEIPMKLRVDRWGRNYSVSSEGPNAFLPGEWISDFINVTLKHQSIRNREIREQKHQDRLREIADLKRRFGISD